MRPAAALRRGTASGVLVRHRPLVVTNRTLPRSRTAGREWRFGVAGRARERVARSRPPAPLSRRVGRGPPTRAPTMARMSATADALRSEDSFSAKRVRLSFDYSKHRVVLALTGDAYLTRCRASRGQSASHSPFPPRGRTGAPSSAYPTPTQRLGKRAEEGLARCAWSERLPLPHSACPDLPSMIAHGLDVPNWAYAVRCSSEHSPTLAALISKRFSGELKIVAAVVVTTKVRDHHDAVVGVGSVVGLRAGSG